MSSEPSETAQLVEARAMMEALDEALSGRQVGDFWESFPLVQKAQALYREAQTRSGVVVDTSEVETPFGKFTQVTVSADGVNEGVGTSRKTKNALCYALEDLAEKIRKSE